VSKAKPAPPLPPNGVEWIVKGTRFPVLRQRLECFLGTIPGPIPPEAC